MSIDKKIIAEKKAEALQKSKEIQNTLDINKMPACPLADVPSYKADQFITRILFRVVVGALDIDTAIEKINSRAKELDKNADSIATGILGHIAYCLDEIAEIKKNNLKLKVPMKDGLVDREKIRETLKGRELYKGNPKVKGQKKQETVSASPPVLSIAEF